MMSSASRVISRCCPDMPSTLNIAQSLGSPLAATPKLSRPCAMWSSIATRLRQLGRVVVGQQKPAGRKPDAARLHQRLRDQQVGRRVRLPRRGVVLADPGFGKPELVGPAQRLQIPAVAVAEAALRRVRRHREQTVLHRVLLCAGQRCGKRLIDLCVTRETSACRVAMNRLNVAASLQAATDCRAAVGRKE